MAIQPPQRFELDDLTHVEREARTIYAPGATPGDVLVVQSDHSLIAAPGGGSQPVQLAAVTIASADILAMFTTPKVIIPAPDPGHVIVPCNYLAAVVSGSTGYTLADNILWLYGDPDVGALVPPASNWLATMLRGTVDQVGWGSFPQDALAQGVSPTSPLSVDYEAQPFQLWADSDNPTDGDLDLLIRMTYFIAALAP